MIYCDECARDKGWPKSAYKYQDMFCDCCQQKRDCNEYPASLLNKTIVSKSNGRSEAKMPFSRRRED